MRKTALFLGLLALTGTAWAGDGTIAKPVGDLVKDEYIVQFHRGVRASALASELASVYGGRVLHSYDALSGASFAMTEAQAKAMSLHPNVSLVEQVSLFTVDVTQSPATWGIDRIDQRNLPLSNSYTYDFTGAGVRAYILDTGIRTTHTNFGGRASWATVCTGEAQSDGHGHGTHVAGTVGSATYGVAKSVSLFAVKICTNGGSCPSNNILCGINFVTQQKQASPSIPMVANMSIGGPVSTATNNAVNASVAAGVFYAVAAGNENTNACTRSPASAASAYTIGATTTSDARSSFSNFGTCVDTFAPGSSITSTWNSSDTATNTISGTSMASPHAAGAGALVLHEHPTWTPAQVTSELNARATTGVLSGIGTGSPNRLLFTLGGAPPPPPDCAVSETFETGSAGWANDAGSTCTTGAYVRANPTLVSNGGVTTQVGGSHGGSNSLFTAVNSSAGVDDVDGGNCILTSPTWSVGASSTLSAWYFHGQRDQGGDASGDFFRLEYSTNGGSTWTLLASRGDQTTNAAWTNASVTVGAGSSVRLRVQCSDGTASGDLVECGVDDVTICEN